MTKRHQLPLFAARPEAVDEAREKLMRTECPRRYCWYWHSLSFDWNLKPDDGCGVGKEHICDALLKRQGAEVEPWRQCCRASGNSQHPDFYEPREPHLEADGWPADFFQIVGKTARRRHFQRRAKSKQRREKK